VLSGGESSRLDRDMVREKEVATDRRRRPPVGHRPRSSSSSRQGAPRQDGADLEARIDAVLGDLGEAPVPDAELAKAKRQLEAKFVAAA
jgi:hypothetical protein